MSSIEKTRAKAPVTPDRRRLPRVDVLLGDGVDSDDEEDGGTRLTPFVAATQTLDDTDRGPLGRIDDKLDELDTDTHKELNNLCSVPETELNKGRIPDWFLGRYAHLASEDSAKEQGPRGQDNSHNAVNDYLETVHDIGPAWIPCTSSLRLIYDDPMSHKWLIGNKYILQETFDDHPEAEYVSIIEAYGALRTLAPKVPIPKIRAGWKENGKVLTITDVISGERLYDIWWDLSDVERENIAKQVTIHIESWRKSDLGQISSLIGGPVYCHDNLFGTTEGGFGPFGSDLELWQAIEKRLKKQGVDEDMVQLLKDHMPPSSPCVFTHGYLSSTNIIVQKGKVVAMTGFENAASLPAWAESVSMYFCSCAEDEQWKTLLRKYTRKYRAALAWWSLWTAVEDASTDSVKLESLKDRCRRWAKTEVSGQPFWSIWPGHGNGASRCLNIQQVDNEIGVDVGDRIQRAIVPDPLRGNDRRDSLGEGLWGPSTGGEGCGSADDDKGRRPKKGGTIRRRVYHQIKRQHHTLVNSTSGPRRQTTKAISREHKEPTLKQTSGERSNNSPVAALDSEVGSESGVKSTVQSRTQSGNKPEIAEGVGAEPTSLRPLSLPSFAPSDSVIRGADKGKTKATTTGRTLRPLPTIREDPSEGESVSEVGKDGRLQHAKRTSLRKEAAPGPLHAVSAETGAKRHKPSKLEEQTRLANVKTDSSGPGHPRSQSMLQPLTALFRHAGFEGRGRVRDSDEKYGFR